MEENDPNKLRDVEIRRLADLAELAYKNATDLELKNEDSRVLVWEVYERGARVEPASEGCSVPGV